MARSPSTIPTLKSTLFPAFFFQISPHVYTKVPLLNDSVLYEQYAHRRTYADTIVFVDRIRRLATNTYPANTFCGASGPTTRFGSSRPQLLGPLRQHFSGSPAAKNAQSLVIIFFFVYAVSS